MKLLFLQNGFPDGSIPLASSIEKSFPFDSSASINVLSPGGASSSAPAIFKPTSLSFFSFSNYTNFS